MNIIRLFVTAATVSLLSFNSLAYAESAHNENTNDNSHGDESAVPYFTQTFLGITPQAQDELRFDYRFLNEEDADAHEVLIEFEKKITDSISGLIEVPYIYLDEKHDDNVDNVGDVVVGLKASSKKFAHKGVLVGGGLKVSLPTGDDTKHIGSNNEIGIQPFVNAGYKTGDLEFIGYLGAEIPTNEEDGDEDEVDLRLHYQASVLKPLSDEVKFVFEVDGDSVASGDDNEAVLNVAPGLLYTSKNMPNLVFGASLGFPITGDEHFESRAIFSVFHHFGGH